MPLLKIASRQASGTEPDRGLLTPSGIGAIFDSARGSALIGRCSNPECRSGWIQLFRSRTRPVFEAGWLCSPECTRARMQAAVHRELDGWQHNAEPYRHRIPLGLLMLEQGWITSQQLRRAIEAQRNSGKLRIGEWLVKQGASTEALVSRAVSVQWSCPVLSLAGLTVSHELLPRLFVEAFGALPLIDASRRIAYLGFEQSVDRALAFSVERMSGKRVEGGILRSQSHLECVDRMRSETFPEAQVAEAASEYAAAHLLAKSIERAQPADSRLVRVHDWLWLRMILKRQSGAVPDRASIRDLVCRVGPF
jgi:hypothetical protein